MARRQDVTVPEGYLAVGKIVSVHGLRGELKVELYTDFPERFTDNPTLLMGDDLKEVQVIRARPHKSTILLTLAEVTSREQGEALRGMWLYVAEEDATELDENTFFVHDILDMTVQDETGATLGVVADVIFTGANEVYLVRGDGLPGGELLLPAIDEVIRNVDIEKRIITIHLLPGMLD